MSDRLSHFLSRDAVQPADRVKHTVPALQADDLGAQNHLYVGETRDTVDQVTRHARGKSCSADEEPHLGDLACEICDRLSGGVTRSNQGYLLPCAEFRFKWRRPIVDAGSLECVQVRQSETAISGAGGDHDRAGADMFPASESQRERSRLRVALSAQADRLIRDSHLDAKLLRLVVGPRHQGNAGNSGREAEVVLDAGRSTGLAAERAAIQHQDREAFRACIDGRSETRRPGSDDRHIEGPARVDRAYQPDAARELDVSRIAQELTTRT